MRKPRDFTLVQAGMLSLLIAAAYCINLWSAEVNLVDNLVIEPQIESGVSLDVRQNQPGHIEYKVLFERVGAKESNPISGELLRIRVRLR